MTDITLIICGLTIVLIGLIGFVVFRYIRPWIMTKINADQWNTIISWAKTLVSLAEKTIRGEHGLGDMRFSRVLNQLQDLCNKYNFKFNEEMLKSAVQYAWQMVIGMSDKDKEEIAIQDYKPEISE